MQYYTHRDIQQNFTKTDYDRGYKYYKSGKVLSAAVSKGGNIIFSKVRGSQSRSYTQRLSIGEDEDGIVLEGSCSCSVGFDCKHVVAAFLKFLDTPRADVPMTDDSGAEAVNISVPVKNWIQKINASLENDGDVNAYPSKIKNRLIYLLHPPVIDGYGVTQHPHVRFMNVRLTKNKAYGANPSNYNPENIFNYKIAAYLRPVDLEILREFRIIKQLENYWGDSYVCPLPPSPEGKRLLKKILSTGRCRLESLEGPFLAEGRERVADFAWDLDDTGKQKLGVIYNGQASGDYVLPFSPPFYIDTQEGTCGPLDLGVPGDVASLLISAPSVNAFEAAKIIDTLSAFVKKRNIQKQLPLPKTAVKASTKNVKPIPCLHLFQSDIRYDNSRFPGSNHFYNASYERVKVPLARLTFAYDDHSVSLEDHRDAFESIVEDTLVTIPRKRHAERQAFNILKKTGFQKAGEVSFFNVIQDHASAFYLMPHDFDSMGLRDMSAEEVFDGHRFIHFSAHGLPELEAAGWRITIAEDYPYTIAQGAIDWWADVKESSGIDWFSFSLGVEFEGEKINLLPTLLNTIAMLPSVTLDVEEPENWDEIIKAMFENQLIYHNLDDGRLLPLQGERLIPIISSLLEMIGPTALLDMTDEGEIKLKPMDAVGLSAFEEGSKSAQLAWKGQKQLVDLGNRLRNMKKLPKVRLPKRLADTLRPYQKTGVNWLSFLREMGFGGVLADDMGLGKTLQVLSFIQIELKRRRSTKPVLVISPTSVLPNWKAEIEKFAPGLKVLVLHGADRSDRFSEISEHDLVLTTYPLLTRDKDILLKQDYQMVVLDEAQVIKNAKAKVSLIACQLQADCRIALTGTPVENNLDELWSLFHFVNPGFLGDQSDFRQNFRKPIESQGNTIVQSYLSRRVKPFMLRRTKEQVALELPPKMEVIENIELDCGQRDLYETIRLVMDKKVRDAISVKGLSRSRIIVLDALLKLRQVCCDPRLLKLATAKKVKQSAKLNRLLELVPKMVAEGRRILIFSQFTSMLSLIEKELKKEKIDFVKITGNTKDRETPVKRFQAGEVPLFLISLKAGGTGLNLTAADTVIHYDPWWNPAVENQATDRAYRIGQDKPVFVHKLIVSNGVEEAIQQLNQKKAALAEAIFSENSSEKFDLTEDDLAALFAPLEKAA